MEYKLVWAKDGRDEKLIKAAKANKLSIPKAIKEKPEVRQYDLLYWNCFMDLCATREMVHGIGFIPWTAINDWAKRHDISNCDEFEVLRFVVTQMDEFWVDHFRKG